MKPELSVIALLLCVHQLPCLLESRQDSSSGNLADNDVAQRKAQIQLSQVKSPENNQDPECISGSSYMKDVPVDTTCGEQLHAGRLQSIRAPIKLTGRLTQSLVLSLILDCYICNT